MDATNLICSIYQKVVKEFVGLCVKWPLFNKFVLRFIDASINQPVLSGKLDIEAVKMFSEFCLGLNLTM